MCDIIINELHQAPCVVWHGKCEANVVVSYQSDRVSE